MFSKKQTTTSVVVKSVGLGVLAGVGATIGQVITLALINHIGGGKKTAPTTTGTTPTP